jgi:Amt family ammonium transporter
MRSQSLLVLLAGAAATGLDYCWNPEATVQICVNGTTGAIVASEVEETDTDVSLLAGDMDAMWIILCAALVFFMQAGFSMLEAGCVGAKNVQNILYKNLMDACVGALGFWAIGYGIAYGDDTEGGFIGSANFFLTAPDQDYSFIFFQWAFAATAATIVSGSVAERTKLSAYFIYSILLTVFVYPVVVHWVWDTEGWLSAFGPDETVLFPGAGGKSGQGGSHGMIDFAGSGVVHMVGGFSGLMGAYFVGPRIGRFDGTRTYEEHNKLLAALGVCILWFGWYGFNAGSTLAVSGGASALAGKVCFTTTIAAASAAVTCTLVGKFGPEKKYDLMSSLNGVLAGLVSITCPCAVVEPWAAFVIGVLGAFVYLGASKLLKKLRIDDPLDAFPIHGCCGFFGVLCPGIFGTDANALMAYGNDNDAISSFKQLGIQAIGAFSIAGWTLLTSGAMFFIMKKTMGLRVEEDVELEGLDLSEHGGSAYSKDFEAIGMKQVRPSSPDKLDKLGDKTVG